MNIKQQITNLIDETMETHRLNQKEMAAALGISRQSLNYWLNGRSVPKFQTVAEMRNCEELWARVFAVRLAWILLLG